MITIRDLTKSYGRHPALRGVSLDLAAGRTVALIGPNGSGKTTLIKILLGLVVPDSGSIRLAGRDIAGRSDYRGDIGYMPQIHRFPEHLTTGQLFDLIESLGPVPAKGSDRELVEALALSELRRRPLGALSGGQRQRVSAALALLMRPGILVLDEPTAALDPVSAELFKEKLRCCREEGRLTLITSHFLADLDDLATDVAYLEDGRIAFHEPLEALRSRTGEERLSRIVVTLAREGAVRVAHS